jgi:hypothetical protein
MVTKCKVMDISIKIKVMVTHKLVQLSPCFLVGFVLVIANLLGRILNLRPEPLVHLP